MGDSLGHLSQLSKNWKKVRSKNPLLPIKTIPGARMLFG
ncbi:hypothetical protein LEP1GSC101_1144 [Leptospira borgpetersenii str. UI 09149]|uniref:Uncharacterized protein n=1 Tax=Leptospira borgpetersenii str. 200701203 TaxID=1193007 RepID=M3GSE2_LEPBO|nr:hypothetical protein LEP1GSC101_1144 [Leptospira borgpetersenii str. UI 09149]EMF97753.1 hypothetical protein LEP1GSC123_1303 [Leptospira borgpetersenii str. 200701203]